jgi:CRISPR/Cas system-associated exonuclease Cas4 (RecB family)
MMIEFNELIGNYLKRELRPKQIGRYYPSECGSCIRKSWYSYKLPRGIEIELLRVFEIGNLVHDFAIDVLKSEKNPGIKLVGSELPFRADVDGMVISGRVDGIVTVKIEDKMYLVEVKSVSSLDYVKEASESHVQQLQLYMHYKGIRNGVIIYVEKNTLKSRQFEINYNFEEAEEAINRFRALHKYLSEEKLPDAEAKEVENMNWQCKSCPWVGECEENSVSYSE